MKSNELMIGNYVYSNETNNSQVIIGINEEYVSLNCITFDYVSYDEIEPIPITEKWLLDFGFVKDKNCFTSKGYLIWICNDLFMCDKNGIILKHVHQLQNLYFALTGNFLQLLEPK